MLLPQLASNVISALHDAHEKIEDGEDGRTDDELVQEHLLDNDLGSRHAKVATVQPFVPLEQDDRKHQGSNYPISGTNYFDPSHPRQ